MAMIVQELKKKQDRIGAAVADVHKEVKKAVFRRYDAQEAVVKRLDKLLQALEERAWMVWT